MIFFCNFKLIFREAMMNKEEGEEIDFSENVSSFKSSDISSSENEENEEGNAFLLKIISNFQRNIHKSRP